MLSKNQSFLCHTILLIVFLLVRLGDIWKVQFNFSLDDVVAYSDKSSLRTPKGVNIVTYLLKCPCKAHVTVLFKMKNCLRLAIHIITRLKKAFNIW